MKNIFLISVLLVLCSNGVFAVLPTPNNSTPNSGTTGADPFVKLTIDANSLSYYDSVVYEVDTTNAFNSKNHILTRRISVAAGAQSISWLNFNKKYYWRTKGFKGADSSPWSSVWDFTTGSGLFVMYQPPSNTNDKFCFNPGYSMFGEFYEYQIDTSLNFNSALLKSGLVPRNCSGNCSAFGYKYPWKTNYSRLRSINGPYKGPWSPIVKEHIGLSLAAAFLDALDGDEYIYSMNMANWGSCWYDTAMHYLLYQDSTPSFKPGSTIITQGNYPGLGNVKLIPGVMNYFKLRYKHTLLKIDTTYQKIYQLAGPNGRLKFEQYSSSVYDYRFTFPSTIKTFQMEFDTTTNFNSLKKFSQNINAKGMSQYTADFRPVSKYIRYFMRYRVTTDSAVYPWVKCKNIRILTPEIFTSPKETDTLICTIPTAAVKSLDSSQYYYFEMDYSPLFKSPKKISKKFSTTQLNTYWVSDTIGFFDTVYLRAYIRTPKSASDWSPVYTYTPKRKVYAGNITKLTYPYVFTPTVKPLGATKIKVQVFTDTTQAPAASILYCLNPDFPNVSANPNGPASRNYWMRLAYINPINQSNWSRFQYIGYINNSGLSDMPNLLKPLDCSTVQSGYTTFRWQKNPQASLYKLTYTYDMNWEGAKRIAWTTDTFFTAFLLPNKNYTWWVSEIDDSKELGYGIGTFTFKTNSSVNLNTDPADVSSNRNPVIFPNPADKTLHIASTLPVNSATVWDLTGKSIPDCMFDPAKNELNVSTLKPAVYLCRVETLSQVYYIRFAKN